MTNPLHAIKAVSLRTGLSAHVIRIWEKRYGAVIPERTGTNRRLYSEEQIHRLKLLREATQAGHSIGQIAKLGSARLVKLLAETNGQPGQPSRMDQPAATVSGFLEEGILAIKQLDFRRLDNVLKWAEADLGFQGLLQRFIAPLAQTIGDLWLSGEITAAHEHFATAVIRVFLGQATRPFPGTENAPSLMVATPAGQLHELGALLVGATATNVGWQVTYLGASLPGVEIAGAARQNRVTALALSIVYPEDDPRLAGELLRIKELLPPEIKLIVGGRAMLAYDRVLKQIGAHQIRDLAGLCDYLAGIRKPAGRNSV